MELVFDVISGQHLLSGQATSKHFRHIGGSIGRSEACDWIIADHKQLLSQCHAEVSYADGHFYLTDTSDTGIQLHDTGMRLARGERQRIEHGQVYCLGDLHIRARLLCHPQHFRYDSGRRSVGKVIAADNSSTWLDPLLAFEPSFDELLAALDLEQDLAFAELPATLDKPSKSHSSNDDEAFWQAFGEALGLELDEMTVESRRQLAVQAARSLRQSIDGLLRCLRTRAALNNALRVTQDGNSPLRHADDTRAVLHDLLFSARAQHSEQALRLAYDDLQTHQTALFAASHAALRNLFDQFAPARLAEQFQGSLLGRWRAYRRHYRQLQRDDWNERLLTHDFANAYENQARLIATLQG